MSVFPELVNEYANLFYACASCNSYKGNYWTDEISIQILNPCEHVMSQHLKFENEFVSERSLQGRFNIEYLRLNIDEAISYRESVIENASVLVKLVFSLNGPMSDKERDWINRTVTMLSKLTYHSEEKIRTVLKV